MIVNPFWMGVFMVLFLESATVTAAVIISMIKGGKKDDDFEDFGDI